MARDFYEVLDVGEDATQEEIQSAYREKVKEEHPDVSDHEDAAERFQEVKRAEEVLGDEDERATYDRLGHETYVRYYEEGAAEGAADPDPGAGGPGPGPGPGPSGGRTAAEAGRTGAGPGPGPGGVGGFDFEAAAAAAAGFDTGSEGGTAAGGARAGADPGTGSSGHDPGPDPDFDFGAAASSVGFGTAASRQSGAGTVNAGDDRFSTDAYTPGGVDDDGGDSTYAVHDWGSSDVAAAPTVTVDFDQESFLIAASLVVVYPLLMFASVMPLYPHVAFNGVIAAMTLLVVGYTLTEPKVALLAFGTLSFLAPVGAILGGWGPLLAGFAVVACWVPFVYALVVAYVARPN